MKPEAAGRAWLAAALCFLAALGLRAVLLGEHALHMDEALYGGFSRRILRGDLLLMGGLNNDKPPLQAWLGALGLALFGGGESALRSLDLLLSAAECALLAWALAPLSGALAALGAGLLLAAAPLHRAYGAAAFMDAPLSLLLLGSFAAAARGRSRAAGLLWGLACWAKQTAFFFLPLPLAAALAAASGRAALRPFARGAAWPLLALLAWALLCNHPRLGMLLGMSQHQPEVGLKLAGLGPRLGGWAGELRLALGLPPTLAWLPWGLPLLGLGLWRRGGLGLAPWAWACAWPAFGLLLFAAMNMRHFDRYCLPLLWPLAAAPALLAGLAEGRLHRAGSLLALALGLAALAQARAQAPRHPGADFDGYRAALQALGALEPGGGIAAAPGGGLRWMGGWYLGRGWDLIDGAEPAELAAAAARRPGRSLYLLLREGEAAPAGWSWRRLQGLADPAGGPAWHLLRAEAGRA